MPRYYHVTPVEQLASALQAGLVPAIGERSSKAGETVPAVYLFSSAEALQDACEGWLVEEFDDDAQLVLLAVDLPDALGKNPGFEAEIMHRQSIAAGALTVLSQDLLTETSQSLHELLQEEGRAPAEPDCDVPGVSMG